MSSQKNNSGGKNYHHGDLRNALIIAAAQIIEESGSVEFAMIDAARRAGVSSAAPYRHFKDKDALLEAVCELGFLGLSVNAGEVRASYPPGSREGIIAQGQAYVRYVTERPQFYDLMWGDHGMRSLDLDQAKMQATGFYGLVESVRSWCEQQGLGEGNPPQLAVKLWCMAHGLAGLAMHGNIERFLEDFDVDELLQSSTNTFLDGLQRKRP